MTHDRPGQDSIAASFAQQGMWISENMGDGGGAYHMPLAIWFTDDGTGDAERALDVPALLGACSDVIDRHQVLGTAIEEIDGVPCLTTAPAQPTVTVVSAAEDPERLIRDEIERGFDLAKGPLARFTLAETGPGRHLLLFVAHHLVFDGMSKDILVRDLAGYYRARTGGETYRPVSPLSFADAAAAERRRVEAVLPEAAAFWKQAGGDRLAEAPEIVLPGQVRSGRPDRGEAVEIGLDLELTRAARQVADAAGATTFEALLAAVHAVLFRYGTENVAVAVDMTTRGQATEDYIGPFVSELPVLSRPAVHDEFRELVRSIRAEVRELNRFREVPFARAVPGVTRRAALTPVSVSYRRRAADPVFPGPAVSVDWMMFNRGARGPLHVQVVDGPDGLAVTLQFDPAAVDRGTAERFAGHLRTLLAHAAAEPGTRLGDLEIMPAGERHRVLAEWNATDVTYPADATLPALFAEQVRARPGAIAATFEGRSLTYAELDAAARRLAHRLRMAEVEPGDLVAVHVRRSDTLLIALLAVHKAGAAYLPMDPDHPADRLAMIIADARPRLLLTEAGAPGDLPGPALVVGADLVADGSAADGTVGDGSAADGSAADGTVGDGSAADGSVGDDGRGDPSGDVLDVLPEPGGLAYVIYTSGSTGRPKGVEVAHGNLANLLLSMRDLLGADAGDAWLGLTSPAFDISALELYLPLITGGRVVIAPPGAVRGPSALARLVEEQGVTHVQATPSVWRLLLPGGVGGPGLTALTGGEALPPALADELRERFGRVVNVYGPTETTIWSTLGEPGRPGEPITIGRPIANTRIYLLDDRLRPVPTGVAGELCVGGLGVARGYRRRPDLTAERFVPDPYGPPGARLYRTGDLARYRADGEIEYLGRADNQVKLLGHRVELGEIEARLLDHPLIRETAVIVRDGESDDHRLIAYIVPAAGAELDAETLTAHLARTLPQAMLPRAYVVLDLLPLNPVGKLDRAALPPPERAVVLTPRPRPASATKPAGPAPAEPDPAGPDAAGHDAAEADLTDVVRRVWQEVLDLDDIGVDDDLFDLGGHSLTITQISARIRDRIGVTVSLDAFFEDPTIAGVVAEIDRLGGPVRAAAGDAEGSGGDESAAVVPRRPEGTPPPLSFAQERLWFLQRFDPGDASYNMIMARRLTGALDVAALRAALDGVIARHENLRTSFDDEDGTPVAVVHPPAPVAVEDIDLTGLADPEAEALRLIAERTNTPFDLAEGPPVRVTLVRLSAGEHVLCVLLHHIICDGWSLNVLFDDLAEFYQAGVEGRAPGVPPMPVQYGDIALWQRQTLSGAAAEESLAYWRERLADPPPPAPPTDFEPGSGDGGRRAAFHVFQIPLDVVVPLERLAQEHGATLFMVLVAAYQTLLARHSGQEDVLVATTWASRDRVELEPIVGYLTDTLILRGDLTGDPTFRDLLDATRRSVLDAHAHHDVPFELLIGELGLPRDVRRNPLLTTMLILHTQADLGGRRQSFGDLASEYFDDGFAQAKFDLALEGWRGEDALHMALGYDVALFRDDTTRGFTERLAVLLRGIAGDPDTPLSRLPLLTGADESTLAASSQGSPQASSQVSSQVSSQAPALPHGDDRPEPVPVGFARQVAATPGATAVVCGGEQVTYAELGARVARLATALRRRGVAPGEVVGVCLGRSVDSVVALLAVWRAGGAYLPLDPAYPDERLAFLVGDARARLVVTEGGLAHRLPPETPALLVGDECASDHETGDPVPVGPGDAAYVIYTSGSTGVPKGVVVEHGALAERVRWMRDDYGVGAADRVAQFASLSFDAHAEELYPALTAGAAVVLLPDGAATLPDVLRARADITVLDLPTAYWHRLTEVLDDVAWPAALRLVILGGEQVNAAAVARWRARFGDDVRLVNTYGPTEATIIATAADLGAGDTTGRPPIGRPIGGTTAHVLGPHGEPVPPGVPGELCLGGPGLARGYLNRPEQTAERFVPDPYGPPDARLYRTGDRARWRRDGVLEFLGRFDDQVKMRGFRVEPGEVTAALLTHPGVRQAVVTAEAERLVAYVVGPATPAELRAHLAGTLPPHLVPAAWVPLDALPLAVTGKVDVAALPVPEPERVAAFVPPRTDAEALVAEVWAQVLGLDDDRVGALDDFFALGGHSLLATRVTARLRSALNVDVTIRTVFDLPVLADLADRVEELLIEQLTGLSDEEAAALLADEIAGN